jgi:WW domain-containing oxidoreductase
LKGLLQKIAKRVLRIFGISYGWKIPKNSFNERSTAEEVTAGIDLSGITALVTGCNSGIGHETMRVLALRGAHVIGTARTLEKAKIACEDIEGWTTPLKLELTDFDSVIACADQVNAMDVGLDVLVCNAGIFLSRSETVDGLEKHFATNYLGHFILVNRLMNSLMAAPAARIVLLGSYSHGTTPKGGIQFEDLTSDASWCEGSAYYHSKLAKKLFSNELARRLRGKNISSNCVDPGIVDTNIFRHGTGDDLNNKRSVEIGAATVCFVAAHPSLQGISGYFFRDCQPREPGVHMRDKNMASRLWRESEKLVEKRMNQNT